MLFMVMSLLYWTSSEGGCIGTIVSISGDDKVLPIGECFNLSCEFTCLRPQHVAQLWRDNGHEDSMSLVNITSSLPSVTVVLSISSATEADAGYYWCMTQPPETISPQVWIQITNNLTISATTTSSTPQHDSTSTQKPSRGAGLLGQMWFWILLGKTTILLLSLATLVRKYKRK